MPLNTVTMPVTFVLLPEIEDLEQLTPGLQDEINMIRIFIRRVIAGTDPDATLAENLEVVAAIFHLPPSPLPDWSAPTCFIRSNLLKMNFMNR